MKNDNMIRITKDEYIESIADKLLILGMNEHIEADCCGSFSYPTIYNIYKEYGQGFFICKAKRLGITTDELIKILEIKK